MAFDSDSRLRLFGWFGILCFMLGVAVLIAAAAYLFSIVQVAKEVEAQQKKEQAETQTRVILRNAVDEYRSQLPDAMSGVTGAPREDDE